jgi:hypothetical protein
MDGILKSFEHQLEMLGACLERLQPAPPADVWRWAAPGPQCGWACADDRALGSSGPAVSRLWRGGGLVWFVGGR